MRMATYLSARCDYLTEQPRRDIPQVAPPGLPLVSGVLRFEVLEPHAARAQRIDRAAHARVYRLTFSGSCAQPEELHALIEMRGIGEGAIEGSPGVERSHEAGCQLCIRVLA